MEVVPKQFKYKKLFEPTVACEQLTDLETHIKSKIINQYKQKQQYNNQKHFNYLNPILLFILIASSQLTWADEIVNNKLKPIKRPVETDNVTNNKLKTIKRLETIIVSASRITRDSKGEDAVFKDNLTTEYHGKEYIERYKGSNPGDMFSGMVGVYSSDARNSGAIVPNIRGVQEFERIPLTIDGTEQAIVAYRGYAGISTRSFLDPMLIGGMTVVKGGVLKPGTKTGVGGAVIMETLDVKNIIKSGKKFGIDVKMELSNNSTKPRVPNIPYGVLNEMLPYPINTLNASAEENSLVPIKQPRDNQFFKFRDSAFRIATGWRSDSADAMIAYVERNKGNHFTGKKGWKFYTIPDFDSKDVKEFEWIKGNYRGVSKGNKPGWEMMNTSFNTKSLLTKFSWRPTDNQQLKLITRRTNVQYGEVMPSRSQDYALSDKTFINYGYYAFPQWPLSKVKTDALSLNYTYNPEDMRWIDFKANLWLVKMKNQTNNSGGSVVGLFPPEHADTYVNCTSWLLYENRKCITVNPTEVKNNERRYGLTTSNRIELNPQLAMTLGGDYEHEKLSYDTTPISNVIYEYAGWQGKQANRAGRRGNYALDMHFDWEPTSWLELGAGARYQNTWFFDDELQRKAKLGEKTVVSNKEGIYLKLMHYTGDRPELFESIGLDPHLDPNNWKHTTITWQPSEDGKYQLKDHPLLNGKIPIDGISYAWNLISDPNHPLFDPNKIPNRSISKPVLTMPEDLKGWIVESPSTFERRILPVFKRRYKSWSSDASIAVKFTPNNRVYLRYSNIARHPSLFEMTAGFSRRPTITYASYLFNPVAERSTNTEIAYVHDLKDWLDAKNYADIKLSYYHMSVKNPLDRDYTYRTFNIDKHVRSGIELQSRYDQGRWFGDLKFSKELKNQVCDKSSAYQLDPYHFTQQECVLGGFKATFIHNMLPPKYNIVLHLGSRWFNEKLEVGTRLTYYSKRPLDLQDQIGWHIWSGMDTNRSLEWGNIFLADAYLNYQISKNISAELIGSNLGNRYYLDPITRSYAVAPGRTVRVGLSAKF